MRIAVQVIAVDFWEKILGFDFSNLKLYGAIFLNNTEILFF